MTEETGGPKAATTPQKLQAFLELARGYLEKRDYVNAKRPLEQALKVDPTSAEAHVLMASVYIADGDTQLAEREYKDALRNEPRNAMAQNNYGTFLFGEERYKDAAQHLKIAANDPSYVRRGQAYENLGLTQLKLNQPADAEQSFLRALMLNSAQPRSALELADLYFKAGDFTRCKQYFETFNAHGPPDAAQPLAGCQAEPRAGRPGPAVELRAGAEEPVSRFAGVSPLSGTRLVSDATPGPGAIVRAQRELRGLTQQDIADTLNLGARVVEDMETENWARLPAPAFTRGYLRAYAKLLDIDPDAVVERVRCGGESRRDPRRGGHVDAALAPPRSGGSVAEASRRAC